MNVTKMPLEDVVVNFRDSMKNACIVLMLIMTPWLEFLSAPQLSFLYLVNNKLN